MIAFSCPWCCSDACARLYLKFASLSLSLCRASFGLMVQAEVDVNTVVEVASLVSSADLPLRDGEEERERFYLTTAINYTNGEQAQH